jgi:hypothetical protein
MCSISGKLAVLLGSLREHPHVTLLARVSAVCHAPTPTMISQAPVRDSVSRCSVRQNKASIVSQRVPAYIDEQPCDECLSETFIPYLANLRPADPFSPQVAMCPMHLASAHVSEPLARSLGEDDVLIVAFPAHTPNIVQALTLCSAAG